MYAAGQRDIKIFPLRCEEQERLPGKEEQWSDLAEKEPEAVAMIQRVQQTLGKLNSLPPRGCFFDSTEYLDDLATQIGQLLSDAGNAPHATVDAVGTRAHLPALPWRRSKQPLLCVKKSEGEAGDVEMTGRSMMRGPE